MKSGREGRGIDEWGRTFINTLTHHTQRRGLRTASTQRYEAHHLSSPPAIFFLPLLYFWLSSILFLFFIYFQFCPLLSFVLDRFNNYVSLSALMDKELDAWSPKHYDEVFNFSLCVLFFSFPSPLLLFLSSASSSSLLLIFFVLCSSSSPLLLLFSHQLSYHH